MVSFDEDGPVLEEGAASNRWISIHVTKGNNVQGRIDSETVLKCRRLLKMRAEYYVAISS